MTPHSEQTRKCSNCMWWEPWDSRFGDCHGSPPTGTTQGGRIWPQTREHDWCGSFRMKEPGQVVVVDGPLTPDGLRALRKLYGVEEPGQ